MFVRTIKNSHWWEVTHLVGAFHLAAEDAAIGGVDAQGLADELGEVGGGLAVVHDGSAVGRLGASRQQTLRSTREGADAVAMEGARRRLQGT